MYTVHPAVTFIKKPRPASFYVRAALGLYGIHKKGPPAGGAYSGDPWSFGAGLCRILHPDFQEFSFLSTDVKIASAAAHFHGFGVARQGPWITWVNSCIRTKKGTQATPTPQTGGSSCYYRSAGLKNR
jgi:hypothetical protein